MPPVKLSIVVPTYNEEGNIQELIRRSHEVLEEINVPHEFIVVDDQSKDRTREQVKNLQKQIPNVVLIERDLERGLATALIAGYQAAQGELLGSMDADLASDPKHLPEMLKALEDGKTDFVIGSRYLSQSKFEGKPFLNRMASSVGQALVKMLLGIRIRDTSNNFRVFKKEVWAKIQGRLHPDGNIMLTEIIYLADKSGFVLREIPIHYIERRQGKSKLSIAKETSRFFKTIWKIRQWK